MGLIVGLDIGGTTTKIIGNNDENLCGFVRVKASDPYTSASGGLGKFLKANPDWSLFLVTTDKEAEEKILQRKADRRRKLYNGRLEVCYYQFHGQKPGK